jgi:FtsZ-binding cell division protein ZapB
MMKIVVPVLFVLVSTVALVFADPIILPSFHVEGAKIVSEGAYFWLEITNIEWMGGSGGLTMLHASDFLVHAVYINNEYSINGTEYTTNDTALCIWNLNVTDKAEILLSAPNLGVNETIRQMIATFTFIKGEERSEFEMSILSLEFLSDYYTLKHEYGELLKKNSDLNQTIENMQYEMDLLSSKNADLNQTLAKVQHDIQDERITTLLMETVLLCIVIVTSITTLYYVRKRNAKNVR